MNRQLKVFFVCALNSQRHYCIFREARFLKRLIEQGKSKEKRKIPPPTVTNSYALNTLRADCNRRNIVLNKVLMDLINDVASCGIYADKFNEYGISITECRVTNNFHVLFIYWIHTKEINEEEVNELLNNFAKNVAGQISSFSIIRTPIMVRFAKDSDFLDARNISLLIDTLFHTDKDQNTGKDIDEDVSPKIESKTLSMQNDELGLDYCKILKDIIKTKKCNEAKASIQKKNEKGESNFD